MRIASMCSTVFRIPRCRVHSLVNTWWNRADSLSIPCKEGHDFRLLSSSVSEQGPNSRRWTRRPITTSVEGSSKKVLSSAANIRNGITDEIVTSVSTNLTIKETSHSKLQQIQSTDVRQLIAENKDLAKQATFIVFDLETTGLRRDENIIEIALLDLQGGENSTFHTLVNPGRSVPNAEFHGITTKMVTGPGVPRMEELIPILLEFVRSRQKPGGFVVMVAHNARSFDVPFLVNEFTRCSFQIPSNWVFLDTVPLAREYLKSIGMGAKYSLQTLRDHFGIELVGSAHRAMSDVRVLALALQKLSFALKESPAGLVQRAFTADELTSSSTKKKKDSR